MSSGFSGDRRSAVLPTTMNGRTFETNINPQHQFSFRSPLARIPSDPVAAQVRRPESIRKRSLAEFQQQNQGPGFYPRNTQRPSKRPLSVVDLSPVPTISPELSSVNPRYGLPILQQHWLQPLSLVNRSAGNNVSGRATLPNSAQNQRLCPNNSSIGPVVEASVRHPSDKNTIMREKLQELEKQLLGDEDDNRTVSAVTDSEWSNTIQNLIGPARKLISTSPTSSSSSCSSTSASPPFPCPKQALVDAAEAISDGRPEPTAEILARVQQQGANPCGNPDQRLAAYIIAALRPRAATAQPVTEIQGKEHAASAQMLYDASPCFKLGFMAANLAMLEATGEQGLGNIHVLDFDIGQGGQYVHLLHVLATRKKAETPRYDGASLKITALVDNFTSVPGEESLKIVGEGLRALARRIGVPLTFNVRKLDVTELSREKLEIGEEALAVNFAFRLYRLPDESVTTENLRDETLRRVRELSPEVVTVVEQELNTNTASLAARVRDSWEYYGLLLDSLHSTLARDSPDRIRIEDGLGRRIFNAVACEGLDRVERCEVFGKWRARMRMAGFLPRQMSRLVVDSLRAKLNSGTRGNPGFCVNEESGCVGFGWMGRNLTVASAWF